MWESPINGCLDEVGREEGERDRHVHLPHAAALTSGDAFGIRSGVGNEFVEAEGIAGYSMSLVGQPAHQPFKAKYERTT